MNVPKQVRLLLVLSLIGFLILLGMAFRLVEKVKVTGEAFLEMTEGKDLLADVLPPPGYLVDLHRIGLSFVLLGDGPKSQEQHQQAKNMIQTFNERHQHWEKASLTHDLHLLEKLSFESGELFIKAFEKAFETGAPISNDLSKKDFLTQILDPLFQTHQVAVSNLVKELRIHNQKVARKQKEQESNGKIALTLFFLCISLLLIAWTLLVSKRIAEQRDVEVKRLDQEAQYRFALNAANMAALEWDIPTGNLKWSQEAKFILSPNNEFLPATYKEFLSRIILEERPNLEQSILKILSGTALTIEIEFRLQLPETGMHWYEAKGQVSRDTDGNPLTFRGIVMNIDNRKALEASKDELENKLLHSQRMEAIGRLAGGVAHDFNNILTGIMGYCDLALEKLENHPAERGLKEILGAAERAARLTKQLLAFSRKQVFQPEVLDVINVVTQLKSMLERIIGSKHELVFETHDPLPPIKADRGQIEQVILNLVVNARDAMPEGGRILISTKRAERAEVRATWGNLESHENVLMLAVSDSGTGIAPEVRASLFQPYFTTKAEGKGTGLGLSTVYGIVQQSGGAIGLDSEVGRGTTFKIFLMGMAGIPIPSEKIAVPTRQLPKSCTLLVAEDDIQIAEVIRQGLEGRGFEILLANNSENALEILKERGSDIDLLLTDILLVGQNGVELAKSALLLKPTLSILFMTGFVSELPIQTALEEMKSDLLIKPFSLDSLFEKVCESLKKERVISTPS